MFPSFEVLECVCAGENAAFPLVIEFVPGISEVVMGSRQSVVEYILDTFSVVTVDVLVLCKLEFTSVFIANLLLWLKDPSKRANWDQCEQLVIFDVLQVEHVI
jgi:hypothetical protein